MRDFLNDLAPGRGVKSVAAPRFVGRSPGVRSRTMQKTRPELSRLADAAPDLADHAMRRIYKRMTSSTTRTQWLSGVVLVLAAAFAQSASAQLGTHSKGPIDITADRAEASTSKCVVTFSGSAEAVQEQSRMRADTMTIYSHPKAGAATPSAGQSACAGTDRIVADGHVYYASSDQNARGDHAVYTQANDEIVLTGGVIVVQGQNVARGDRLTIKVATHEAVMESDVTGANKSGRVRAVFYPDKKDQPVASSASAPEPKTATDEPRG